MKTLYFVLFWLAAMCACAQKFTISGTIRDKASGESLIGASIYNPLSLQGTTTNAYGFYSLTLPKDSVHLRISYVGYRTLTLKFKLERDTVMDLHLNGEAVLQEVVVTATTEDQIQESSRMGTIDVPVEFIKSVPALLGETDVLKVLQLLPGVQAGTEGSSGLYVRGGGPDQNLILLDGVPVYNASHLFGFISVFNADAINHVEMIKGGFPARYGGRLSSVIDISMKEGNNKEFKAEGSIGLVASRLTVEGPIIKNKTSFIISGRRTYIDLLTRPIIKASTDGDETAGYYFYDLNTKINHQLNARNRIYLSAYLGDDKAYSRYKEAYEEAGTLIIIKDEAGLRWGNVTTALRWNSILSNKFFSNVTATYSRYRFDIFAEYNDMEKKPDTTIVYGGSDEYISGIRDYALKWDIDVIPNPSHFIKFGIQGINHLFTPGVYRYRATDEEQVTLGGKKIYAQEYFAYIEDDFLMSPALKINIGLHGSAFNVERKFYTSLQPRVSGRYLLNSSIALKSSYASMTQYIHLLTNAGLGLPTDLWVPTTPSVRPERSYIAAVGAAYNINNQYELSLEGYYKKMKGLIEYKEGARYLEIEKDWQSKIDQGNGESYGAELFLQKKAGRFNGWMGYTLSWTNRTFPNINEGKTFPFKYDRRHDLEIALTYQWKENKDIALTWVYGTGNAVSLPKSTYSSSFPDDPYDAGSIDYYEGRNSYRMRAYHRLDLSYTSSKKTRWGERSWSIAIYNVYSRKNPFYIELQNYYLNEKKKFVQYSLFPIIPSIAYRFKF
ncbi:MAG: TonB-dependent receptor [Bacteroidota bacterium]